MTKKAFKYDMQRGLGSCVLALKNMEEAQKEAVRSVVLWGCSRDLAYDAQCEGCRSIYLYDLITEFSDVTPFLDVIERRLFHSVHSNGWEFHQDCEILAYFVSDRIKRAWKILVACYHYLFQILLDSCGPDQYGRFAERDNFQSLCTTLVSLCSDSRIQRVKIYQRIVRDLCTLSEENPWISVDHFDWFQSESEDSLGKKTLDKLLHRADADAYIKKYVRLMEEGHRAVESKWEKRRRAEPETAEALYRLMQKGEKVGKMWTPVLMRRWLNQEKEQEVLRIAAYYKEEKDLAVRFQLLRLLANKECAQMLDLERLIQDSKSEDAELSEWAFEALAQRKDARVRAYALELLNQEIYTAGAVSMLAKNYEICDRDIFVKAVKQIPITYRGRRWHGVFSDLLDLFETPGRGKPTELLLYMYRNTLCSFCREYVVREMGRRRMLTQELLEEMQYDCNEDIRKYADKKLSDMMGI